MSPKSSQEYERWMAAALALGERGRGRTSPNPNVGCVIVRESRVVGRGWTQPGGRPHAEAMALARAGAQAKGATAYVTLEPCAHESGRGQPCAPALVAAGIARVVAALGDPDPRTDGRGFDVLEAAGVTVARDVLAEDARRSMAGFLARRAHGRPHVTLKLATSLDGRIAMAGGGSRWITGEPARAHAHLERARADAILVGRETYAADAPSLDVRLKGLEDRSPRKYVLATQNPFVSSVFETRGSEPTSLDFARDERSWDWLESSDDVGRVSGDWLLIEGGARTAASFLAADLVDRLLLYRAPILIGDGTPALTDIGLAALADAHGRWLPTDARQLGVDRVESYERVRE